VSGRGAAERAAAVLQRLGHRGAGQPVFVTAGDATLGADGGEALALDGVAIAMDGSLHMYDRLHEELAAEGHKFRTDLHAEVVVALYADFRENTARMLDGEFSFILADGDALYLGRDRYGIRSVFYGFDAEGRTYAATEEGALAGLVGEVRELPPGHYYHSRVGEFQYFEMPPGTACITNPVAGMAIVRYHLEEAVERRLPPEGPVAVFLDGGIEAAVVAGIARKLGTPVELFATAEEREQAARVAEKLGLPLVTVNGPSAEAERAVERLLGAAPPEVRRTAVRTARLAEAARERGHRVALSSAGATELFGDPQAERGAPEETHRALQALASERHLTAFRQLDRLTAAYGLDGRAPYGDPYVAIAAWEVNPVLKYRDGRPLRVLEEVAARYMPTGSPAD
jgi:asparagine synthase (glutamine-hydrolysing)